MTARGKNVKQQHLLTETEVFLYDKQYISPRDAAAAPSGPLPQPPSLRDAPKTITNQNSLEAWRDLFMARRSWALEVTEYINTYRDSIQTNVSQTEVIRKASLIALENVKNHVCSIRRKFENTQKWARETLSDQSAALDDWQDSLKVLEQVPARRDFRFLLRRLSTPTKDTASKWLQDSDARGTLSWYIHEQLVRSAASDLSAASMSFDRRLQDIEQTIEEMVADTTMIEESLTESRSWQHEDIDSLFEEAETLVRKITSDYEEILRLQDNAKSIATASRWALVHTRDFLPSIKSITGEIYQVAREAAERRNSALKAAMLGLQNISRIESGLAGFQSQLAALDVDPEGAEALDTINVVFQLPVAYGSSLIEAIRRTEWHAKLQKEAEHLTEEFAQAKNRERRRRKEWADTMGGFLHEVPVDDASTPQITVPDDEWPMVNRDEIFTYIDDIRNVGIDDAVQQVTQLFKELEPNPKSGRRPGKAFKNGSVHDLERSSLLVEDDAGMQNLKDEKLKLEDKLRASDSRIRKLEDILHRHSQTTRPLSGNFGEPTELDRRASSPVALPSPRPSDMLSRRSSVASRRLSNQTQDEKMLVQKIVALEADVSRLQREAHAERRSSTEHRDKMQEAESTKRDLMANFDAQRQEFDDERQLLEDEAHKLKIRLEEVEDELDRVLGSREHQKLTSDQAVSALQTELAQFRQISVEELAKAQGQTDLIMNDFILYRDRVAVLDKQVQQFKEEKSQLHTQNMILANQVRDAENKKTDYIASLQAAHIQLSPGGSAPDDLSRLVNAIEILSEGLAIHARGQEDAAQLALAENRALEENVANTEAQLQKMKDKLSAKERETLSLQDTLVQERSRLAPLRSELEDERAELKNLRSKFAAGETGSEALKERVNEEERRVAGLTEELAIANSKAQNLEQELTSWKEKVQTMTSDERDLRDRLNARGLRARDLSQRLFYHNDRMVRMLEQMGYSVTRHDDRLHVQRASKVNASTILAGTSTAEGSASMNRTLSGTSPTQHYSSASDLETLYWMSDSGGNSEDIKFQSFVSSLSRLDVEAATDLIAKRHRDIEALARKYQKESRAYREKAHRLQGEARDKIAYRSFKEGDLALFLPTRNQATRPWAAFNVGAPHYFLREQDIHKLQTRDWLLARISKVEERVVDLSLSMGNNLRGQPDRQSINTEASDGASTRSVDDENPFELSDGLRWYMIDASEEKPGAPTTPGLGKSTVASTNVDVKGSIRLTKEGRKARDPNISGTAVTATKTLSKSLDSRRSSSGSKKGHTSSPSITSAPLLPATNEGTTQNQPPMVKPADADIVPGRDIREEAPIFEAVRKDLLLGP